VTYGECVGPVESCNVSEDCPHLQTCESGFCQCPASAGDLCIKDGIWECVIDPLSEVSKNFVSRKSYGQYFKEFFSDK
jgi:hypothetical protein